MKDVFASQQIGNDRYGSKVDEIRCLRPLHVCFTPESGHRRARPGCPLSATSRHPIIIVLWLLHHFGATRLMTSSNLVGWATPKPGPLGEQNVLSRCSRPVEFLFASDGTLQTKLSYFFGCIDFAPCDGEIDLWPLSIGSRIFSRSGLRREKTHHGCKGKASSCASSQKQGVTNGAQTE
jgi:hypothetical protein